MRHFMFFAFTALLISTFSIPLIAADETIFDNGFENPKPASALTSSAIPRVQDETATQRGSEVTDNGINTATVGFDNKFNVLLKDEDGRTIGYENPLDEISCKLTSVGTNDDFVADEVPCSASWEPLEGSSQDHLVLSYRPLRTTDLANNVEWQLQMTINGGLLVAASRSVVYAGLLDYSQSSVEILSGADGDIATAGYWIEVLITGYDSEGNRRVFENDGVKKFTANVTNTGGGDNNKVVNNNSQLQSSFTSDADITYQGEGQYLLRFYPFMATSSLQVAYNAGGVTHDFVVRAGDPAPTSRLRSDGQISAQNAICGGAAGCAAGQDTLFTLDSRDAFGAGHDPVLDLACAIFYPGCSNTGSGNSRGSAEGNSADYTISMTSPAARVDAIVSFVGASDPDFFTYSINPTIAASGYSLAVRTDKGAKIRGGCNAVDCLTNADNTTTLSAFTPVDVVAGFTYPPYLQQTYSPGNSLRTACIPNTLTTLTLRPTDFWRNAQPSPDVNDYSATVTGEGSATVSGNGELIEITYPCPNGPKDTPYTIDVYYAGNPEHQGQYTFRLQGTLLEPQSVYAFLYPVQEPEFPPASFDPSSGPTSSWDMQNLTVGVLANWTLKEFQVSSYSPPLAPDSYFSITLEDKSNPGTFLWPAPVMSSTPGVQGQYDISFTPEVAGEYTVRIFRQSILPADITSSGPGFSVRIDTGSVSGTNSFVTGLPNPAAVLAGETGYFLVDLRDKYGNMLSPNPSRYEIGATYSGTRSGEVDVLHSGTIDTSDCAPNGLQFRCSYNIAVAADYTLRVHVIELGGPPVLVGKLEGYPLTILAGPASPINSTVFGPIPDFVAGVPNSLYLIARDEFGNRARFNQLNNGIDPFVLSLELNPGISPDSSFEGNGVSRWTFTAFTGKTSATSPACASTLTCPNQLSIFLNGVLLAGSPFQLTVLPNPLFE